MIGEYSSNEISHPVEESSLFAAAATLGHPENARILPREGQMIGGKAQELYLAAKLLSVAYDYQDP